MVRLAATLLLALSVSSCASEQIARAHGPKTDSAKVANYTRLLNELHAAEVIHRVEPIRADYVRVIVGPRFAAMSYEEKVALVNMAGVVAMDGDGVASVILKDWRTNHRVGMFVDGRLSLD